MFIDATYEGDLMAAAGCDYHVGREANSVYGEEHNGVQVGVLHHGHHFGAVKEEDQPLQGAGRSEERCAAAREHRRSRRQRRGRQTRAGLLLPLLLHERAGEPHPVSEAGGLRCRQYELLLRVLNTGWGEFFEKFDPIPNHKTDTNNHGPFSFDNIGYNYDYPEASYERRKEIIAEHRTLPAGLAVVRRQRPARAGEGAGRTARVGPAQG
jgi:hypothetical protein